MVDSNKYFRPILFLFIFFSVSLFSAGQALATTCLWENTNLNNSVADQGNWSGGSCDFNTSDLQFTAAHTDSANFDLSTTTNQIIVDADYSGSVTFQSGSVVTTTNITLPSGSVGSVFLNSGSVVNVLGDALFDGGTVTTNGSLFLYGNLGVSTSIMFTFSSNVVMYGDNKTVTVSSSFDISNGLLSLNGSNDSIHIVSGGILNNNFSSTFSTSANINNDGGSVTFYNLNVSAGTLNIVGNVTTTNDTVISSGATLNLSGDMVEGHTLTVDGAFNQTLGVVTMTGNNGYINSFMSPGSATFYDLLFNASPSYISLPVVTTTHQVTVSGTLYSGSFYSMILTGTSTPLVINEGATFASANSTFVYSGTGATVNIASTTYGGLTINTSDASIISNITTNGNFTVGDGFSFDLGNYDLTVNGNLTVGGNLSQTTGTTTVNNGTIGTNGNSNAQLQFYNLAVLNVTNIFADVTTTNILSIGNLSYYSNITLAGNIINLTATGTPLVLVNGVMTVNTSTFIYSGFGDTVNIANTSYANLVVNSPSSTSAGTITLNNGNLTINAGNTLNLTTDLNIANGNLIVEGVLNQTAGTVSFSSSTITNNGNSNAQLNFYHFWNNSNLFLLADVTTTYRITNAGGVFDAGTSTINLTSSTSPFVPGAGTFNANSSTLIFYGTGGITYLPSMTFYNLIINSDQTDAGNISVNGDLIVNGNVTAGNITMTGNGKTISGLGNFSLNQFTISGDITLLTNVTTTGNFTINSNKSLNVSANIIIVDNYLYINENAIFNQDSGSVTVTGSYGYISYTGTAGTATFYDLNFNAVNSYINFPIVTTTHRVTVNGTLTGNIAYILILTDVGTPLVVNEGATLNSMNSTLVYSGTGSPVNVAGATYGNLTINTSDAVLGGNLSTSGNFTVGAGYNFNLGSYDLTVNNGILTAEGNLTQTFGTTTIVNGTITNNGNTNAQFIFYNLNFQNTSYLYADVTTTNEFSLGAGFMGATFYANGSIVHLIATGTPFVSNGGSTFNAATSTIIYSGFGDIVNIAPVTYANLIINSPNAVLGGNLTTNGNFTLGAGNTLDLSNDLNVNSGNFVVEGILNQTAGTVTINSSTISNNGNQNAQINFYNFTNATVGFDNGLYLFADVTTTHVFSNNGNFYAGTSTVNLTASGTPFSGWGTFYANSSTFIFSGIGGPTTVNNGPFYNLIINGDEITLSNVSVSSSVVVNGNITGGYLTMNGGDKTISGDGSITLTQLTINASTTLLTNLTTTNGSLTINDNKTLNVSADIILSNAYLYINENASFNQTSGSVTVTSSYGYISYTGTPITPGVATFYDLNFNAANSYINLPVVTSTHQVVVSGTLSAGATYSLILTATGTPLIVNEGATFSPSNSTVVYSGSGDPVYIASTTLGSLTINTSDAHLGGNLSTSGNLTVGAGYNFDLASYDLTVNNGNITAEGNLTQTFGTTTITNGTITNNGNTNAQFNFYNLLAVSNVYLLADVTTTNVFTLGNGFMGGYLYANGSVINLIATGTPFVVNPGSSFYSSTSTIIYSGSGGVVNIAPTSYANLIINSPSSVFGGSITTNGNFTLNAGNTLESANDLNVNSGNFVVEGILNQTAGTVTFNSSTISNNGNPNAQINFYNFWNMGNLELLANVTTTHVFNLGSGTFNAGTSTIYLTASGTPFVPSGTFNANSSTFVFSGTGGPTSLTGGYGPTFYNVIVTGDEINAGVINVSGDLVVDGTITTGDLTMSGNNKTISGGGDITLSSLTISASTTLESNVTTTLSITISDGAVLHAGQNTEINLTGNGMSVFFLMGSGVFDAQTSTVNYLGTSMQISPLTFYNLSVNNSSYFSGNATTTNDLIINDTDLNLNDRNISVGGDVYMNGNIYQNGGGFTLNGSNSDLISSGHTITLGNLVVNGTSSIPFDFAVSNVMTINGTLNVSTNTITLNYISSPLVVNGTFNLNSSTISYAGTGSAVASLPYYNLLVNANSVTLPSNVTTTNDFTTNFPIDISASNLTVGGNFVANASVNQTSGNLNMTGDNGNFNSGINMISINNLNINGTTNISSGYLTTNILTINNTLNAGTSTMTLAGEGAPFVNNGTFNSDTSTLIFSGNSVDISPQTYYNLTINNATAGNLIGTTTINNLLHINTGKILNANTSTINLLASGESFGYDLGATFNANSSTVNYLGSGSIVSFPNYYNLVIGGSGSYLTTNMEVVNDLTVNDNKSFDLSGYSFIIDKNLVVAGDLTQSTGSFVMSGTTTTISNDGHSEAQLNFNELYINGATILYSNVTSTNVVIINGTLEANTSTIVFAGTGTPMIINGTFNAGSSTINYVGAGATVVSANYYNLLINNIAMSFSGDVTTTNNFTLNNDLIIVDDNLTIGGVLEVNASLDQYGGSLFMLDNTSVSSTILSPFVSFYDFVSTGTVNIYINVTTTNSFSNTGYLVVAENKTLSAPGTYSNIGTVVENGKIKHPVTSVEFVTASGTPLTTFNTGSDVVYVQVQDDDANLTTSTDSMSVIVTGGSYNDSETITLTETGGGTGIFRSVSAIPFQVVAGKTVNNSKFDVSGSGSLNLAFIDSKDSIDTGLSIASFSGSTYSAPVQTGGGGGAGGATAPASPIVVAPTMVDQTFSIDGSKVIKIGNVSHRVQVNKIDLVNNQATFTIESKPIIFTLKVNEERVLDTDGDKENDVRVKLNLIDIQNKKVNLSIVSIVDLQFNINHFDLMTTNRDVTLYFNSPDAKELAISESVNFNGVSFEKYEKTKNWRLSAGNGYKKLYVKFRTAQGGVKIISSEIKLDEKSYQTPEVNEVTESIELKSSFKVLNTDSNIVIEPIKTLIFKPNSLIKYSYSYRNVSGRTIKVKILRQIINSKGKSVDNVSGVRTINKGQTFKFTGTNSLNNKVVDGSYLIRIRVLDHKNNKIIDENSFNVTVKKPLSVAKKPIVKKK